MVRVIVGREQSALANATIVKRQASLNLRRNGQVWSEITRTAEANVTRTL
jgi:hypothetical protein